MRIDFQTQTELREQITQPIIAALKSGGRPPWRRPWRSTDPGFSVNVQGRRDYWSLVDWDTEGSESDPCNFVVSDEIGHEYVASGEPAVHDLLRFSKMLVGLDRCQRERQH